jgi:alpha-aminoadipate/glutamate carrier protein LysW
MRISNRKSYRAGPPRSARARRDTMRKTIVTPYGLVEVDPEELELGELVVTDEGSELEVVGLDPIRFEPAPEEEEDWGE